MNIAPRHLSVGRLKQYANDVRNDIRYGVRRMRSRPALPPLPARDRPIVEALEYSGAYVTSLEELGIDGSDAILMAGDQITWALAERPVAEGRFTVSGTREDIDRHSALIRWGLDERLLGIVSNYIGMPIAYRGLTVRRDIVGGPENETRMWHRDNEDNRIVKIIVYLNGLDENDGPFEYLPRFRTPPSWRVPFIDSSRVTEQEMLKLVPRTEWRACTGPRGTVVIVDTCRVFHRGRVASREDRRTLFYCYNSQQPLNPQWCSPLFDMDRFIKSAANLSEQQLQAIHSNY